MISIPSTFAFATTAAAIMSLGCLKMKAALVACLGAMTGMLTVRSGPQQMLGTHVCRAPARDARRAYLSSPRSSRPRATSRPLASRERITCLPCKARTPGVLLSSTKRSPSLTTP